MPRTGRRRTQPIRAPQDQGYGERGDQIAAQRAMPLPDNRSAPLPEVQPEAEAQAQGQPVATPQADPVAAALAGAQQMPPPGLLNSPGDPSVPITAGLPGRPGEEVLAAETPRRVAILQEVARLTDDPALVRLIHRAVERQ